MNNNILFYPPEDFYKVFTFETRYSEDSTHIFLEISKDIESVYKFYCNKTKQTEYSPRSELITKGNNVQFRVAYEDTGYVDMRRTENKNSVPNRIFISNNTVNIAAGLSGTIKGILFVRMIKFKEFTYTEYMDSIKQPYQQQELI